MGCLMIRRWPGAIPPSTPCLRCRRLESTIRAVLLSVVYFTLSGVPNVLVWHLCPPYARKLLDETVKTIAVFPWC